MVILDEYLISDLKTRKEQIKKFKKKYGDQYDDQDLVCCYENGEALKPKRIWEAFEVLTQRADLDKIRFHDLRHTYLCFLLA